MLYQLSYARVQKRKSSVHQKRQVASLKLDGFCFRLGRQRFADDL